MFNGIMRLLRPGAAHDVPAAAGPVGPITTKGYIPRTPRVKAETMQEHLDRTGPVGAGET